ncbi:MAG: NAD-dependent epimerase/dehydratase family protein [Deltaproteobacteria bacterium]|nr:NAD-dependent epimerase/dehydratase family protein [Deltaproteobacteria bacterium]
MSKAKVLVTGGAGFIGSHVGECFMGQGFDVRVLDDLSTGFAHNCDPSWELLREDVRDPAAVAAAVAGCEAVVHLAAFTSVPESFECFADCYRVNVLGTYNVLRACADAGVRKLVFASSSAVYAELPDAPKSEADCPDPISPYAVSKLEGEHLLELFGEIHGVASVALRFFNVYGPRQPADSAYAAAVPIFMERGLRGEPLTVYGDGRQTRDFVFVGDVAEAVYEAARSDGTGVFNVGTGTEIQILELADLISELTGRAAEHRFEPLRPGDLRSSTADIGHMRAGLGWSSRRGLQDGLLETLKWYRERLGGPAGS